MKTLKINFVDFWPNFPKTDNYFYHTLSQKYSLEIEETNPDILFFSCFGKNNLNYRCKKILFLGENVSRHNYHCDLSLTFDKTKDKNVYFPLWILFMNWFNLEYKPSRDPSYLMEIDKFINKRRYEKSKFCSFIVGNPNNPLRNEFCNYLSQKYKFVECPGLVNNNVPKLPNTGHHIEKIEYLQKCKFNLCFENSKNWGYITEKIVHPLYSGCVPIYWGGDVVEEYFDPDTYINCNNMNSYEEILEKIRVVDQNEELYEYMTTKSCVSDPEKIYQYSPEKILPIIERVIK